MIFGENSKNGQKEGKWEFGQNWHLCRNEGHPHRDEVLPHSEGLPHRGEAEGPEKAPLEFAKA